MKIIYTAEPIQGLVESPHLPVQTRLAKEKLKANIEEILMPMKLVTSYTITDNENFPFPFKMPNAMAMDGFFGENPDYNQVARELKELFGQPKKEYAEFETKLKNNLETATDEQILEMVEKFHYTPNGTKARHAEAIAKIGELWKPYPDISESLVNPEFNPERGKIRKLLAILDDCHIRGLVKNISKTKALLELGQRDEAKEEVLRNYSDWRRKNLAHLHNACGDASFYGAGFWMARLVAPDKEVAVDKYPFDEQASTTAEKELKKMKLPYQVILL